MFTEFSEYKEFHVMYVVAESIVDTLKNNFIEAGATNKNAKNPNSFFVADSVLKQRLAFGKDYFPNATVNFYTDVYELAKDLPVFDADLIILDERQNSIGDIKEQKTPVNFKNLQSAIDKFTPSGFNYTMQRIIVVLPQSAQQTQREFELGVANLRAVIIDPPNVFDFFLSAIRQLFSFWEKHKKTSLCISGGGLEGYLYSIGVISALDACIIDKDSCDFDIFCGVSSGAIIASILAAGIHSDHMIKQIYGKHPKIEPLRLKTLFDPAAGEIAHRLLDFLRTFATFDSGELIARLQQIVPTGFFKGEKLKKFLEKQMQCFNIEDNMAALKKELYISVTDQDTGENVVFGEEPWRDIRVSQAVRASTALPPFYLPERINGHWFTDGQLTSASDFTTAIRKGAGLIVCVDPMVPYTSNAPGSVVAKGGYFAFVQAIKSLVQTRSRSMVRHAMDTYPDVDFIVFKPNTDKVMGAMAGNPMKYRIRIELVDIGYRATIAQIFSTYEAVAHKFAKHGFTLKSKDLIADMHN